MKTAILLAGMIASGILGALLVVGGIAVLFVEPLVGLAYLFLLAPIALSLSIVFAHVSSQLGAPSTRASGETEEPDRFSDIRGTPWESDSDPNQENRTEGEK